MRTLLLGFAILLTLGSSPGFSRAAKMNVIVVLIDDLGHTDLGCQGNTFHETPHLDQLARDGMRFTTAYSACTVCSPTRAALLTGMYPARLHITDWIAGHKRPFAKLRIPDWTMQLSPEKFSLARAFKQAGYATASMGKWHLGGEEYYPEKHGFDLNVAGTHIGSPPSYFSPYKLPTIKDGPKGEFLSDRLSHEAGNWMEQHKDKPFLLYLPHYAVHTPIQGKADVSEKYRAKASRLGIQRNPVYAALVESIDDSMGILRKKLNELKIADRTVIIFTSDNGGLIGNPKNPITTNPPFRVGKGSAYEGGVRVPFLVYWPGVTKPGTISDAPVMSIDIFPTLMTGLLTEQETPQFDGISFLPALKGEAMPQRPLYWHYPHYHPGGATPYSAIRDGDYRLVEFFEDGKIELYDLKNDVGETTDLASKQPEKVNELKQKLAAWRKSVGAQMPSPNPMYDPQKEQGKKQ